MDNCVKRLQLSLLSVAYIFLLLTRSVAELEINADERCLRGTVYHGQHCYTYFKQPGTYVYARDICAAERGQLVKITDEETFRFIRAYLERMKRTSDYWIGISDRLSEGNWTYLSDDTSVLIYSHWFSGEPNNGAKTYANQDCGAMRYDLNLQWVDRECDSKNLYICKFEGRTKNCTSGYIFKNNCYHLSAERKTFYEGENTCLKLGGKLVEIKSMDEQAYLRSIIQNDGWWMNLTLQELDEMSDGKVSAWIGVHRDGLTNYWMYSDGEYPINPQFWSGGKPDTSSSNCVAISTRWMTAPCSQFYPFICQFNAINWTRTQQEDFMSTAMTTGIGVAAGGAALLAIVVTITVLFRYMKSREICNNASPVTVPGCEWRPPLATPRKPVGNMNSTRDQQFYSGSDGYMYPLAANHQKASNDNRRQTYLEIVITPEDHVYDSIECNANGIN